MSDLQEFPQDVVRGLDTKKFREFVEFAKQNPEAVQFVLEASGVAEDDRIVHTHASVGPYTLGGEKIDRVARKYSYHFGAHREVEGALGFVDPTDREEATETVLAALTACINAAVTFSAAYLGIDLQKLRTDVNISWDPFVFLHINDPEDNGQLVDQFGKLNVTLTIDGDGIREDELEKLRTSVKRSAVFNLISLPHACEIDVRQER